MLKLDKYIDTIKTLKPQATCYTYNPEKWYDLSDSSKQLIREFENKKITRGDVVKAYKVFYKNGGDILKPFLLTMVWGFGNTGYGTHRTNNYLIPENEDLIKKGLEAVKNDDLKLAFKTFKKIKGLGISYFSKLLYFASKGAGLKNYYLIFDIRVAKSFITLTTPKNILSILEISPSKKFKDYVVYNELIHQLADKYGVEADVIELFLFQQKF